MDELIPEALYLTEEDLPWLYDFTVTKGNIHSILEAQLAKVQKQRVPPEVLEETIQERIRQDRECRERPDREELREKIAELIAQPLDVKVKLNRVSSKRYLKALSEARLERADQILSLEPSGREEPSDEDIAKILFKVPFTSYSGDYEDMPEVFKQSYREHASRLKALFRSEEEIKQEGRREVVEWVKEHSELEKCDPTVMAYFSDYYDLDAEAWQAQLKEWNL